MIPSLRSCFFCLAFLLILGGLAAQSVHSRNGFLPSPVIEENFAVLTESSPFLRAINVSGSVALTGVARIEGRSVVALVDVETNTT